MKNNRKEFALALTAITQLGVNVVVSFLLWIFIATWIKNKFSLGNYVVVTGIVLGMGSAALSFYDFCKKVSRATEKENHNED